MECLYYMPDAERVLREIARVLSREGTLLIVSANPSRPDFVRSPFSHMYHEPAQLSVALEVVGLRSYFWGGFSERKANTSVARRAAAFLIRTARQSISRLGLVPRTLEARARLKRFLYWRLTPLPAQLDESTAPIEGLAPLTAANASSFRVFYCLASESAEQERELPERFIVDPAEFGDDEVRFLLLARRRSTQPPTALLPDGYTIETWVQSIFALWPPGIQRVWRYPAQFLMYLNSGAPLRGVIVRHCATGRVVHLSLLHARSFRFPFMRKEDLQIGGLWTMPGHRSRGLARAAVAAALTLAKEQEGFCWYVVADQNQVSIRLAEELGFEVQQSAHRHTPLGIRLIRRFELDKPVREN